MSALALSGGVVHQALRRFKPRETSYSGSIQGAAFNVGHLLKDATLTPPEREEALETVIIGGGISGLSAAWWLKRNGYQHFTLLELEAKVGGNSQSGQNEISAYPWGAHYLPLPGPDAQYAKTLLEELGVIESYDSAGRPVYNEFYLCSDPHERLLIQGIWQEGLIPHLGISASDRSEYQAFFRLLESYKTQIGRDGKRAFSIPVETSSQDQEFLRLDQQSMADFMRAQGWTSSYLHWYVNYCCRDDYGMGHEQTSAWAGIHYFASRIGTGANADAQTVLTWPEGNGWLVEQLRQRVNPHIRSHALAYSVQNHPKGVTVDFLDSRSRERTRIQAKQVIFAAPRFIAARTITEFKEQRPTYLQDLHYTPWLVANISLSKAPQGNGAPLSWENVSYQGRSMGYVVATHQSITLYRKETVLTYYLCLDEKDPATTRKESLQTTHSQWAQRVAADLERMHPGIQKEIKNIDIWLWGHGMISPKVGFIWGKERRKMQESLGHVHFAHSDMSGISIFEEAQYQGVRAAERVLAYLKQRPPV